MRKEFYQRLKLAMEDKGYRQVDLCDAFNNYCKKNEITDCKMGKSLLSMYLSGKAEPNSKRLAILAHILGVSEAWLLGYDVAKGEPSIDYQLGNITIDIEKLTDHNKALVKAYIQALLDSQEGQS